MVKKKKTLKIAGIILVLVVTFVVIVGCSHNISNNIIDTDNTLEVLIEDEALEYESNDNNVHNIPVKKDFVPPEEIKIEDRCPNVCRYHNFECPLICETMKIYNWTAYDNAIKESNLSNESEQNIDIEDFAYDEPTIEYVRFEEATIVLGGHTSPRDIYICHEPFTKNTEFRGWNCMIKCNEAPVVGNICEEEFQNSTYPYLRYN